MTPALSRRQWIPFLLLNGLILALTAMAIARNIELTRDTEVARLEAIADLVDKEMIPLHQRHVERGTETDEQSRERLRALSEAVRCNQETLRKCRRRCRKEWPAEEPAQSTENAAEGSQRW